MVKYGAWIVGRKERVAAAAINGSTKGGSMFCPALADGL